MRHLVLCLVSCLLASSGASLWLQHWISDPAGPMGFSASNGLMAVAP